MTVQIIHDLAVSVDDLGHVLGVDLVSEPHRCGSDQAFGLELIAVNEVPDQRFRIVRLICYIRKYKDSRFAGVGEKVQGGYKLQS